MGFLVVLDIVSSYAVLKILGRSCLVVCGVVKVTILISTIINVFLWWVNFD